MTGLLQGIGSRLMIRQGYVMGQGLGRNQEGRAEPVPIQLLPVGAFNTSYTYTSILPAGKFLQLMRNNSSCIYGIHVYCTFTSYMVVDSWLLQARAWTRLWNSKHWRPSILGGRASAGRFDLRGIQMAIGALFPGSCLFRPQV